MGRKKTKKRAASRIPDNIEKRVVVVSLANSGWGARRLVPLLEEEGIQLTTSAVYTILKRRGLENRTKRLAALEKRRSEDQADKPQKIPAKISLPIEERIVEISMQHPDYGAKRLLPLLKDEEIIVAASTVYTILKRHGLQNRSRRLAPIDEMRPVEIPQTIEAPVQEPEYTVALPVPLKDLPPPEALRKPSRRSLWVFAFLNLLLIALVLFLGVQAVQNITNLTLGPVTAPVPPPTRLITKGLPEVNRQLDDYNIIWQRNLFNISNGKPPVPVKTIPVEKISLASKKLGLKLAGTVVADDADQNLAIIDIRKIREQKAFHEGDQIGKVRIKKIQRNKVIITTEKGDELLILDPERSAKNYSASSSRGTVDSQSSPLEQDVGRQSQIRSSQFSVQRQFVTRFLGDPEEFLQNIEISPYMEDDQPAGFQIAGITPNNPLGKLGLINGDVIMAINRETITSPQQAADFLRKLMEGGKIKIRLKRNRSRHLVRLNIN